MIKKWILLSMWIIIIVMFFATVIKLYDHIKTDIVLDINCSWNIQLFCWEKWCEELCYPSPIQEVYSCMVK